MEVGAHARKRGLVPVYWDNGSAGNQSAGLFIRRTGEQAYLVDAIVKLAR